jgi:hypothetical protein
MRLRVAVQQQQGRPTAAMARPQPSRSDVDGLEFEIVEKWITACHRARLPTDMQPDPRV